MLLKRNTVIKLLVIFFITACMCAAAKAYAQNVTLKEINTPLEEVFKKVEKQTGYTFTYTKELLTKANPVSIDLKNASLNDALKQIFIKQPLSYTIYNKMVVIKEKEPAIKYTDISINNQQSYAVSGTVTNEKEEPVAGATVFITNSKKATATNGSGKFNFDNVPTGNYELVVNMLGYEPERQSIKIQDKPVNIIIKLKASNTLLNAVTIKDALKLKPKKRFENLFFRNFIGTSANAGQCKILNPEVLNFYPAKGYVREVTADGMLEIENDALGYKIKYLLKKFVYYSNYDVCYYDGNAYFEELQGTEQQQKQWDSNRRKAYLGSARHFFRAAMNNRTRAEGFFTYEWDKSRVTQSPLRVMDIDAKLMESNKNFKVLISKINGAPRPDLYVYYIRANGHEDELTWIKQCRDTVTIDKNGGTSPGGNELFNGHPGVDKRGMTPNVAFAFWGRWGLQRVADLTPLDYFAEPALDSAFLKPDIAPDVLRNNASIKKLHQIIPIYVDSLIGAKNLSDIKNQPPAQAIPVNTISKPAKSPDSQRRTQL